MCVIADSAAPIAVKNTFVTISYEECDLSMTLRRRSSSAAPVLTRKAAAPVVAQTVAPAVKVRGSGIRRPGRRQAAEKPQPEVPTKSVPHVHYDTGDEAEIAAPAPVAPAPVASASSPEVEKPRASGLRRAGRRAVTTAPVEESIAAPCVSSHVHYDTDDEDRIFGPCRAQPEAPAEVAPVAPQEPEPEFVDLSEEAPAQTAPSLDAPAAAEEDQEFTVMIRNIACSYSKQDVTYYLGELGFDGTYSEMHLPGNPARQANLGYVFISFTTLEAVERCTELLAGKTLGPSTTNKKIEISWAHKGIDSASKKTKRRQRLREAAKASNSSKQ